MTRNTRVTRYVTYTDLRFELGIQTAENVESQIWYRGNLKIQADVVEAGILVGKPIFGQVLAEIESVSHD